MAFPPTTILKPSNPKIKICLSGLGILCLNATHFAEIGYLDIPLHETKISIWKNCEPIVIKGTTMINQSMRGKNLGIYSNATGNCQFYSKPGEAESYESMIDLKEIYSSNANLKFDKAYQCKIFIHDSVFFTEPNSIINVEQYPEDLSSMPERKDVGTGLWGYSKDDDDSAFFIFDGTILKPGQNEVYTIRIFSDCGANVDSDFKYFYDYLQNPGSPRYNLRGAIGNQWMIDCEIKDFNELVQNFGKYRAKINVRLNNEELIDQIEKEKSGNINEERNDDKDLRMKLQTQLSWLKNALCAPEPCLKVTFLDKARSLSE